MITPEFLDSFASRDFGPAERRRFIRALTLLDENERHPSLRVHALHGDQAGIWSASASDALRMTFRRADDGRKVLLTCSRHYDRQRVADVLVESGLTALLEDRYRSGAVTLREIGS